MTSKPWRMQRWQFSVGVIMPAALLLAVTAVAVAGFVAWSTAGIDERALEREMSLAARAVERQIAEVPHAQETIAIWDDAITNTKVAYDKDWLDNNLGVWMNEYYGIDAAAVISDSGEFIYAMVEGGSPSPALFYASRPVIEPLVAELRAKIAEGALDAYNAGTAPYPGVLDLEIIDGRPAIVSVLPITSQTGAIEQRPGEEYLHLAIEFLDGEVAGKLRDNYHLSNALLTTTPARSSGDAIYPLFDREGRIAVFLEWNRPRPGLELLNQTGPVLTIAFLMAGVLVVGLVNRLWASTADLERQRVQARHEANHDPLTGLPNRAQFDTQLSRDLVHRKGRPPIALMILDLDRFKQVNDTLGHDAGDALICAVGQRLQELVGPADIIARLGGDEFAVIHPCAEGSKGALALAQTIVDAVAKPFLLSTGEAFVGASIGLAFSDRDADDDPREMTRKADIALYEAKARGRNRAVLYADVMSAQLQDRLQIENELREALKRDDQLSVAFQPQYSGATGEIAGAEVLVRWSHPKLGQVAPARFVPIAESSGLIEALGEFVLRRACMFSARFPGKRIAVNISPAQMRNPRFPERVFDLLVETAMRPSDLELEITESILIDSEEQVMEALTLFRKAGIRIALDDFGTGYSSLNYLKRYPVDCIKIDRSFVAQLSQRGASAAIVQAMVTLAHALGIEVTAEGVETHEQMTILKAMGCNHFQGFLLSPPAAEDIIETTFRRAGERRRSRLSEVA